MIIDCHQHTDWHGIRTPQLVEYLDRVGVDKCWLLSWESIDGSREDWYMHLPISHIVQAAQDYPGRFIIGAGVDPRREHASQRLREYHQAGARVYGEIKLRITFDTPELIAMFRVAGELGMPVLFHLELPRWDKPGLGTWYAGDIDAVERALKLCPDTQFVGHGPGWWAHISNDSLGYEMTYPKGPVLQGGKQIRLLEQYPNIWADISAGSGLNALKRFDDGGRQHLIDWADRILYGVDYFDTRHIEHLRTLNLPPDVQARIMGDNAQKLVAE